MFVATLFEAPLLEQIRSWHVTPVKGFHDLWEDARMEEIVDYLQSGMCLNLPEDWQDCWLPNLHPI